jgi:class 3 adenylate cyclase/tetratricopeptide (TPR) repeat protein
MQVTRMRCSNCASDNPPGKRFCGDCGKPLVNECPKCGAQNPPGKRFCGDCGTELSARTGPGHSIGFSSSTSPDIAIASPTAPETGEGERKTVTALFADIKGSTELMEELDPEEARTIIDPALKLMIDAVNRYDGHIVQSTGDGIFALFGAPLAHEDHPQRAVYAALRMQDELRGYGNKLQEQGRAPLEIRVGVNSGEVVVRSIRTGQAHTEYTPIGHTANLASRLQAIARTGSIVISDKTRSLVEGYFQLRALGATQLRGIGEPVKLYEVNGVGPLRTRFQRAAGRGLTKFVGRRRELDAIRQALQLAKAGHGQLVAAIGEPGVGKSRLFFEFKAIVQSECSLLEAYSVSYGKASAYLPLIELLRDYFRIMPEDDQRQRREKITGKVLTLERSLEDTLPYLFSLFGLEDKDDSVALVDPQIRARRTLEGLKRILLRESLNQPLMVIFEDLHWIDEQTQEFLNLLADSIGTAQIMLLVNYRPEYSHHWNGKTYYMQLRLDPLSDESAEELLSALLGDGVELAPLKRRIIETTEGNPFFIEEMVQELFEEGVLARNGTVKITRSLSQVRVPSTVQGILASRIDRLPSAEKDFLQTLAVLGREFSLGLVRQVTDKADDVLERMLANLQLGEFIYEQPAFPELEYTFKHALTQEVAYHSVLTERRRMLHERAGAALEQLFHERLDEHLEELARHYQSSANVAKAVHYLSLAALRTAHQGLLAEGTEQAGRALKLLEALPDTPQRLHNELDLLIALVLATGFARGFGAAEGFTLYERAAALSRRLGDTRRLFGILTITSVGHLERGEFASAEANLPEIHNAAGKTADASYMAAALTFDAWTTFRFGRFAQARINAEKCLIEYEHGGHAISEWLVRPDIVGLYCAGLVLWPLGLPDRALARGEEAVVRARGLDPVSRVCSLHVLAEVRAWRRDLRHAQEAARDELDLCTRYGIETGILGGAGSAMATLGWVQVMRGELADGLAQLRRGIEEITRRGQKMALPLYLGRLAMGLTTAADLAAGSDTVEQALSLANETGEHAWDAELLRVKGEIALKRGENDDAARDFRSAIEMAQAQEAKSWELRAATCLARLLIQQDRSEEAHALLVPIYGWFTEGFDTADLKDAKALLAE